MEASAPTLPAEKAASRRRFALPMSLVVTLLGAALTVWLAPAFTRQWDDRQHARDLKTTLAQEMVAASVRTIRQGVPLANGNGRIDAVRVRWHEEGLKIKVKMEAYFAPVIVSRWERFVHEVDYFLFLCQDIADARADPRFLGRLDDPEAVRYRRGRIAEDLKLFGFPADQIQQAAAQLASTSQDTRAGGIQEVRTWALANVEAIIGEVLEAHLAGFSTTRGDLLHDLLP